MLPADETLLRLADPATRGGVLTSGALLSIATVCWDIDPASVVGDTTAVYDRLDLAVPVGAQVAASGRWGKSSDPLQTEGLATITGLVPSTPGADAVWTGSVVVRTAGGDGVITAAGVTDHGRDAEGVDDLTVGLAFSALPAVTAASAPLVLPVVVAFLVADVDTSPRTLLQQGDAARRAAGRYPTVAPAGPAPGSLQDRCVCWLVPAAAFDDVGWPGAVAGASAADARTQRVAAAQSWLAAQAIAVVPV